MKKLIFYGFTIVFFISLFCVNNCTNFTGWIPAYRDKLNDKCGVCLSDFVCKRKTIVWFGDSIVGNVKDETSVTNQLSLLSGALVYNIGFGGCRMSRNSHVSGWNYCSMYSLANYMYNDHLESLYDTLKIGWPHMPYYFPDTGKVLAEEIDFSSVDVIIISFGTNDWCSRASILDDENDIFNVDSVCGALRYSVKLIKEKYPNIRIVITSPIYRFFLDDENRIMYDSNNYSFRSGTLIEYTDAYKKVCEELEIDFIDLYNNCPIKEDSRNIYFSGKDGTHPNEKGRKVLAKTVYEYLLNHQYL